MSVLSVLDHDEYHEHDEHLDHNDHLDHDDHLDPELQKRADRADQSVLFFLCGANFWEKHAKDCAIMSMAHITYAIAH